MPQIFPWLLRGFFNGIIPWDTSADKPQALLETGRYIAEEIVTVRDVISFLQYADARMSKDMQLLGDDVGVCPPACFCEDFEVAIEALQDALVEENPEFECEEEFSLAMLDEGLPLGESARECFSALTELFLTDEKLRDN